MKTKTIKVNVTQKDIGEGMASSCYDCPIATALARASRYRYIASVSLALVVLQSKKSALYRWRGVLPDAAKEFVTNFDSNGFLRKALAVPFSFTMKLERS